MASPSSVFLPNASSSTTPLECTTPSASPGTDPLCRRSLASCLTSGVMARTNERALSCESCLCCCARACPIPIPKTSNLKFTIVCVHQLQDGGTRIVCMQRELPCPRSLYQSVCAAVCKWRFSSSSPVSEALAAPAGGIPGPARSSSPRQRELEIVAALTCDVDK